MDINSQKITDLLTEIEKVRRRKIVDYETSDNVEYVDGANNVKKLNIPNNNLIFGRRGSGKTTLIIASMKEKKNIVIPVDIQLIKDDEVEDIIIDIIDKALEVLKKRWTDTLKKFEVEYKKQYKGVSGKIYFFRRKRDEDVKKNYEELKGRIEKLVDEISIIDKLKEFPYEKVYSFEEREKSTNNNENKNERQKEKNAILKGLLLCKTKNKHAIGNMEASGETTFSESENSINLRQKDTSSEVETKYKRTISKYDVLQGEREKIAELFNISKQIEGKGAFFYLDDFYQINLDNQPAVIQYFHDVYKLCKDGSFCFKIAALPNRLKMNPSNSVDMSFKDDFSTIKLDYDLSELDRTRDYLIKILSNIKIDLELKSQDLERLFNNNEVLYYAIIATGGNPRDFLLMFADVIEKARQENDATIKKEHIYSVVKSLRDDKDNNIEIDADIDSNLIREAVGLISKEVVGKLNTNVFLYPKSLAEKHENLLKNLINLRYLHLIKDSVSSETRKKEEFVAYLVDMSFYAVNKRLKQGFEFVRFWEKDKESRLLYLRKAKIWNFPDDICEKLKIK